MAARPDLDWDVAETVRKHGLYIRQYAGGVQADLRHKTLRGTMLAGADLSDALFAGADLRGSNFSGCNLTKAQFSTTQLERADFAGAKLISANLRGANLKGAKLMTADMTDADLRPEAQAGWDGWDSLNTVPPEDDRGGGLEQRVFDQA